MKLRSAWVLCFMVIGFVAFVEAGASVVNVDLEDTPPNTHVGDDGVFSSPGATFWNGVEAATNAAELLDETGAPTNVGIEFLGNGPAFIDASATNDLQDTGSTNAFQIRGLQAGQRYSLAVYASPSSFVILGHEGGALFLECTFEPEGPTYVLPGEPGRDYCTGLDLAPADLGGGVHGFELSFDGFPVGFQLSGVTASAGCESDGDCDAGAICEANTCVPGCRSDGGCASGEICVDDSCTSGCRADGDCESDEICEDISCVPGCRTDAACGEGETCEANRCVPGCVSSVECGPGQICVDRRCTAGCSDDLGCRIGEICEDMSCVPGCREDDGCPGGEICEEQSCIPGCHLDEDCDVGEACHAKRECVDAPVSFGRNPNISVSPDQFSVDVPSEFGASWGFEAGDAQPHGFRLVIPDTDPDSLAPFDFEGFTAVGTPPAPVGRLELDIDGDGEADVVLAILSIDDEHAFVDTGDEVYSSAEDMLLLHSSGSDVFDIAIPWGGDRDPTLNSIPMAGRLRLTIDPGIMTPRIPGTHTVWLQGTAVDPHTGGPFGGTPPYPQSFYTETEIEIVAGGSAPDCTDASADASEIWPPNHKLRNIAVVGVTDSDGDPIDVTVTGIRQDEPVNGIGDGTSCPDGEGIGTAIARVRAERTGSKSVPGDGRVYRVSFDAEDGQGGSCSGSVTVCVPHDRKPGHGCVDQGPLYDSAVCN